MKKVELDQYSLSELCDYLHSSYRKEITIYFITYSTHFCDDNTNFSAGYIGKNHEVVDSIRHACFYIDEQMARKAFDKVVKSIENKQEYNVEDIVSLTSDSLDFATLENDITEKKMEKIIIDGEYEELEVKFIAYQNKDLTGAICVKWAWQTHVGYCRKFLGCFTVSGYDACHDDSLLVETDSVFVGQCSLLMTAEEVEKNREKGNLDEQIFSLLKDSHWKWQQTDEYIKNNLWNDL